MSVSHLGLATLAFPSPEIASQCLGVLNRLGCGRPRSHSDSCGLAERGTGPKSRGRDAESASVQALLQGQDDSGDGAVPDEKLRGAFLSCGAVAPEVEA